MKYLLSAAALAAILSTPAMAEKTPVKPTDTCTDQVKYALIMHHLAEIEAMLDKLEASQKLPAKKPVDDAKTPG